MMRTPLLFSLLLVMGLAAANVVAQTKSVDTTESTGVTFSTGASSPTTERMRVTQNGRVGINTTNPGTELEVNGEVSASTLLTKGVYVNVPIGVILPWHKSMTGTPSLPTGWVECNGQTLSDASSPLNGQTIPNLNSQVYAGGRGYYLRGGTSSGVFNASSYFRGNGSKYIFGQSSGTYYAVGYGAFTNTENAGNATYSASDNNLGTERYQVAAVMMVYIMKVR